MEERIRTFTEQEHNRFADMQLQIGRNEETLYSILDDIQHKLSGEPHLDQSLAFSSKQHMNIVANVHEYFDFLNHVLFDAFIPSLVDADLGLDSYLNIKSTQNITNAKPLDNKQKKSQPL
ncbi:unnamed protein product, partial [Oppiella nova]